MANLTITVDPQVLKKARIRALEDRTSVNAVLRTYLERYAGTDDQSEARAEILRLAAQSHASSGPEGRTWTREELYDRPRAFR